MSQNWMRFAGINGALAVGLGAFGAHGLKSRLSEYSLGVFQTGNQYHQLYSMVILALIFLGPKVLGQDRLPIILRLFTVGTCIFSGSLYILSIAGIRWMGAITPIGGVCFILGWLFLAFSAQRSSAAQPSE
jgi:uncharacterized membrane protein YgdD (TMEM256/DUF423 family)